MGNREASPWSLILLLVLASTTPFSDGYPLKPPFRPSDILPLLPRQMSKVILNTVYAAADLLPSFVGAVSSPNSSVEWKGACFYKNRAWTEFNNASGTQWGGGTLHINALFGGCLEGLEEERNEEELYQVGEHAFAFGRDAGGVIVRGTFLHCF